MANAANTDLSGKEIFLSRVRSLLEVLSSHNADEESLKHDFDNLYTCAYLFYHHSVRLASVHVIHESTTTKLRNVINFLTEKRDSLQSTHFYAQAEQRTSPGRPKLIIT